MLFSDGDSTTRWRVADMSRRTQSPGVSKTARRASDGMRALKSVASSAIHGVAARFASLIPDRVTALPRSFPAEFVVNRIVRDATRERATSAHHPRAHRIRRDIGLPLSGCHLDDAAPFCLLLAPALLVWLLDAWAVDPVGPCRDRLCRVFCLSADQSCESHRSTSAAVAVIRLLLRRLSRLGGTSLECVSSILCGIALGVFVYFLQPGKLPPEPVVGRTRPLDLRLSGNSHSASGPSSSCCSC